MTTTAYRVYITGIVLSDEGDPKNWSPEDVVFQAKGIEVKSSTLDDTIVWPVSEAPKRSYTCSICGGRHSARWCHNG